MKNPALTPFCRKSTTNTKRMEQTTPPSDKDNTSLTSVGLQTGILLLIIVAGYCMYKWNKQKGNIFLCKSCGVTKSPSIKNGIRN